MKKAIVFLFMLAYAVSASAKQSDFELIDNEVYEKVLELSSTPKEDIKLYRKIFSAISKNNIKKADKYIGKLKGTSLLGHVLAQKYLSKDYKSTHKELVDWLEKYPYFPQYDKIKNLSILKDPDYKPEENKSSTKIYASYSWYRDSYSKLKTLDRKYVREEIDEFIRAIRKGDNDSAAKILQIKKFRMTIPDRNYDSMSATLAGAYLLDGDNEAALKWVKKAVNRSKDGTAAWWGGLAAYREKDYKLAAEYFGKLAEMKDEDEWLVAAGGFWAYRSYNELKSPEKAKKYLKLSAKRNKTFYGILSGYILTGKVEYNWLPETHFNDLPDKDYVDELVESPNVRRAILLLMVGQNDLAEEDLKKNFGALSKKQQELLLYLSKQYSLANLSFVISSKLRDKSKGREYHNFNYPNPTWEPNNGWKVNPAWVWALARQESLFSPSVRSHAGACGLMQVMPATAALVTKDKSLKKDWSPLLDKQNNLTIGQDYIVMLKSDEVLGDNLFYLAASYNGGPHNLKKWFNRLDYGDDPLMFVELIPWKETRLYVKKVVANYWIYNARFGNTSQSLQQLVNKEWPMMDEWEVDKIEKEE